MASGKSVKPLPVDERGVIDLVKLGQLLNQTGGRAVVAIHHANNESGVIQPIAEAARMVRAAKGWLHVDAIQSAGKIAVDMRELDADSLTLSAHKLGGPQGAGALIAAHPDSRARVPLMAGGGQERGRRGGTHNVPAMVGFGAAAADAAASSPSSSGRGSGPPWCGTTRSTSCRTCRTCSAPTSATARNGPRS